MKWRGRSSRLTLGKVSREKEGGERREEGAVRHQQPWASLVALLATRAALTDGAILPTKHPSRHAAALNPPALVVGARRVVLSDNARAPVAFVERAVEGLDGRNPELEGARLATAVALGRSKGRSRSRGGRGGRREEGGGAGGARECHLGLLALELLDDGWVCGWTSASVRLG